MSDHAGETDRPPRVTYTWTGSNRRGGADSGTLESVRGPAAFTERRFQQGWRRLSVMLDGVEVAAIEKADGRRHVVIRPAGGGSDE